MSDNPRLLETGLGAITLRDLFAAAATTGMLAYPGDEAAGSYHNNSKPAEIARFAYDLADALLAARAR
jgi:hypothetical protein